MADMKEPRAAAGRHLAADLKQHRVANGIAVKDVMDVTRMAQDVVEELETSGLMNSPIFNRVYLRSMYGSYAEAIGLPAGPVLEALDAAMKGVYEPGDLLSTSSAPVADADEAVPESVPGEDSRDADETESEDEDSDDTDFSEDTDADEHAETTVVPHKRVVPESSPFTTASSRNPIGTEGGGLLLPNTRGLAAAVVAGILLIALVWFAVSWLLSSPDQDIVIEEPDTTAVLAVQPPMPDPVVLPDTMTLYLTAVGEPLDPIRVTIDRDLRRPYWIEHDSTEIFRFANRIVLEREVDNARLALDGYLLPGHWMQADGSYVVDRTVAQAWFDSLTTNGMFPRRVP